MSGDAGPSSLRERIRSAPRHSGGRFEDHLEGTASLLRDWGCRPALEQAGRYHSVYGSPEGLAGIASSDSDEVRAEIGEDAEQLVVLWSQADHKGIVEAARAYSAKGSHGAAGNDPSDRITLKLAGGGATTVAPNVYLDLAHLHAANTLEYRMRTGKDCRHLDALRPLLCPEAVALLNRHRRPPRIVAWWRRLAARLGHASGTPLA